MRDLTTPSDFNAILEMFEDVYALGDFHMVTDFTDRAILRTIARQRIRSNCMQGHTVSSVARSVGVPLETCRRRVKALEEKGFISRDEEGLDIPEAAREQMRIHLNEVWRIIARTHRTITRE